MWRAALMSAAVKMLTLYRWSSSIDILAKFHQIKIRQIYKADILPPKPHARSVLAHKGS